MYIYPISQLFLRQSFMDDASKVFDQIINFIRTFGSISKS